jgi:flagellar protein FliS
MDAKESDMARMADVRSAYTKDKVTTTPERLITMLYDRLVRDLLAAEQAIADRDRETANAELQHAQAIIIELLHALDTNAWPAGKGLSTLYAWLIEQLLQANVRQDAEQVRTCRELIEPLCDAWHQAVATLGRSAASAILDRRDGAVGAAV